MVNLVWLPSLDEVWPRASARGCRRKSLGSRACRGSRASTREEHTSWAAAIFSWRSSRELELPGAPRPWSSTQGQATIHIFFPVTKPSRSCRTPTVPAVCVSTAGSITASHQKVAWNLVNAGQKFRNDAGFSKQQIKQDMLFFSFQFDPDHTLVPSSWKLVLPAGKDSWLLCQ